MTFNGIDLFGVATEARRKDNPRALQENSFPGLSGIESLDQGSRGRVTHVTGRIFGNTGAALNANILLIESYKDERAYVFVDQYGNAWPAVKMEAFEPTSRVTQDLSGFSIRYQMLLKHLI